MTKVNLSVHKSNLERRERKQVIKDMRSAVDECAKRGDVIAYATVAFTADGNAWCAFDTGKIMPLWAFDAACAKVIENNMAEVDEDFRAPLRPMRFKR